MTQRFDVERYLDRIGISRLKSRSPQSLALLQESHLRAVPFENLDIRAGRPLSLDIDALFDKIVTRRRGGFCYEVNGLFARLLRELGYDVTLLSCRTYNSEGKLGPEHDHLALLVRCQGRWLVDVGFGDAFPRPLDLDTGEPQILRGRGYRVVTGDDSATYVRRHDDSSWAEQYTFAFRPRTLATFEDMCVYHQTSPSSHFTKKHVCTRLTGNGRITLSQRDDSGRKLIRTVGTERTETPIDDDPAWRAALAEHFGVVL